MASYLSSNPRFSCANCAFKSTMANQQKQGNGMRSARYVGYAEYAIWDIGYVVHSCWDASPPCVAYFHFCSVLN